MSYWPSWTWLGYPSTNQDIPTQAIPTITRSASSTELGLPRPAVDLARSASCGPRLGPPQKGDSNRISRLFDSAPSPSVDRAASPAERLRARVTPSTSSLRQVASVEEGKEGDGFETVELEGMPASLQPGTSSVNGRPNSYVSARRDWFEKNQNDTGPYALSNDSEEEVQFNDAPSHLGLPGTLKSPEKQETPEIRLEDTSLRPPESTYNPYAPPEPIIVDSDNSMGPRREGSKSPANGNAHRISDAFSIGGHQKPVSPPTVKKLLHDLQHARRKDPSVKLIPWLEQALSGLRNSPNDRQGAQSPQAPQPAGFPSTFNYNLNVEMQRLPATMEGVEARDFGAEKGPRGGNGRKKRRGCKIAVAILVLVLLLIVGSAITAVVLVHRAKEHGHDPVQDAAKGIDHAAEDVGHDVASVAHVASSKGNEVVHSATSIGDDVFQSITKVGGEIAGNVTSIGGEAIHTASSIGSDIAEGAKSVGSDITSEASSIKDDFKTTAPTPTSTASVSSDTSSSSASPSTTPTTAAPAPSTTFVSSTSSSASSLSTPTPTSTAASTTASSDSPLGAVFTSGTSTSISIVPAMSIPSPTSTSNSDDSTSTSISTSDSASSTTDDATSTTSAPQPSASDSVSSTTKPSTTGAISVPPTADVSATAPSTSTSIEQSSTESPSPVISILEDALNSLATVAPPYPTDVPDDPKAVKRDINASNAASQPRATNSLSATTDASLNSTASTSPIATSTEQPVTEPSSPVLSILNDAMATFTTASPPTATVVALKSERKKRDLDSFAAIAAEDLDSSYHPSSDSPTPTVSDEVEAMMGSDPVDGPPAPLPAKAAVPFDLDADSIPGTPALSMDPLDASPPTDADAMLDAAATIVIPDQGPDDWQHGQHHPSSQHSGGHHGGDHQGGDYPDADQYGGGHHGHDRHGGDHFEGNYIESDHGEDHHFGGDHRGGDGQASDLFKGGRHPSNHHHPGEHYSDDSNPDHHHHGGDDEPPAHHIAKWAISKAMDILRSAVKKLKATEHSDASPPASDDPWCHSGSHHKHTDSFGSHWCIGADGSSLDLDAAATPDTQSDGIVEALIGGDDDLPVQGSAATSISSSIAAQAAEDENTFGSPFDATRFGDGDTSVSMTAALDLGGTPTSPDSADAAPAPGPVASIDGEVGIEVGYGNGPAPPFPSSTGVLPPGPQTSNSSNLTVKRAKCVRGCRQPTLKPLPYALP